MRGAAGLLIACTVLRALAPAAGVAETVDHSTNAEYWRCNKWPEAIKFGGVKYFDQNEPVDDDSFVWFCPSRCNSMPYFDIKLSYQWWERTGQAGKGGVWLGRYSDVNTLWKGNRDYRALFPSELQSNQPQWPEAQVSAMGTCRTNRNKENIVDRETQCWPEMKHLNNMFVTPVYVNGAWESSRPLDPCRTGATAVEMNPMACFRTETENIFVTPAYVFWPGATPLSTSPTNECRVARVDGSNTETKVAQYWSNPPTYQHHSLEWKSLKTDMGVTGWVDEHKTGVEGDYYTKGEFWKQYEWMCSFKYWNVLPPEWRTGWNYYGARLYESGCKTTPCGHFRTQSCWQNAYSFAASPCVWRKKTLLLERAGKAPDGYVSLADVTTAEFAASMHAYGNGRYTLQFDRRTMDASRQGSPALAATETTLAISSLERFRIALKPDFSCEQCEYADQIKGKVPADKTKKTDEVAQCVACRAYEKLVQHLCETCAVHGMRTWDSRASCSACPTSTPMRRAVGAVLDENCTTCQVLDYFNGQDANGCLRLASVMDGLRGGLVVGVGADKIFGDSILREVKAKAYRAVAPRGDWWTAVSEVLCDYTADAVARAVQLSYRRWCGHREIVREQQALLQVENRSEYYLLKWENTTAGYAAISALCGATLRPTTSGVFDLQCTDNRSNTVNIGVVRKGDPAKCTVCPGAQYTSGCMPTYHPDLASEEAAYFLSSARLSSAGACAACAGQCAEANHYMSPVKLSCMWDGGAQRRVAGSVSAQPSAGLFYWYKPAPCKPCVDVALNTTHAMLIKQCGNKRTYRTWDALQSTLVPAEDRSIPMTQTCCSKWRYAEECTNAGDPQSEDVAELSWVPLNCKAALELEDAEPVQEAYCPPGWYVDEACARRTPDAWAPDCCKRCDACGPGWFKTEIYAACTGATYIDTEKNGCERSCLSNSYRKDGRCFRCEQCSTTGTGEHDL